MEIQRVPILIGRTPILGIRKPIITHDELNWEELYKSLVNYIKFASKQVYEQSSNCLMSAEDLFQEGQLLLYNCYLMYKYKSLDEFNALFKSSLWRKLRVLANKKEFIQVDITDAYDIGYTKDVTEGIFEEYKLQQAVELLEGNDIAITILREMINPSERTLWECRMDQARKQMLKDQGFAISVPQANSVKGVHIQRALEIPKSKYKENLQKIREVFTNIYQNSVVY